MTIQPISLAKLIPSKLNVRKTGANAGIEELAASIKAHGLLQNLQVKRLNSSGTFEVVAGGRRLKALKLLAKRRQVGKNAKVDCNVLTDEDAGEISLAENIIRLPMHPADQFDAFKAMADAGKGDEEIAARFGCTPAIVRQRLKLASVSPSLIAAYRAEELSLDHLMAFTVTDDHKAQEECWQSLSEWNRSPQVIRRTLTDAHIEANDPSVVLVGLAAYIEAGGQVTRDLFQPMHKGWLTDADVLNALVAEKLAHEAETVRAEGWKWVEIVPYPTWETMRRFELHGPEHRDLPKRDQKRLARLSAEHDALAEDENADPARRTELVAQIDALTARQRVWTPEHKSKGGALISVGDDGCVAIERGLLKLEDRTPDREEQPSEGEPGTDAPNEAEPTGLSAALVEELTAHRTAALQATLADNPHIALAALLHALVLPLFYNSHAEPCVGIRASITDLSSRSETMAQSEAVKAFGAKQADWAQHLPEFEVLWPWLLEQDDATLTNLLAVCVASSVNAVRKPHDRLTPQRSEDADRLASALKLDMTQWWQPASASYFARVPKAKVLDAVTEACSKQASDNLVKLKKDALCARAEALVEGKGWLPELLRPPS